jgi:hypothetical protein
MKKTASVYTNDKNRPRTDLVIVGTVEKFATIQPKHVSLKGHVGDSLTAKVSITPETKYPFKVINVRAKEGKNIKYQLDKVADPANGAYECKIRPQLSIRVYGNLRPPKKQ